MGRTSAPSESSQQLCKAASRDSTTSLYNYHVARQEPLFSDFFNCIYLKLHVLVIVYGASARYQYGIISRRSKIPFEASPVSSSEGEINFIHNLFEMEWGSWPVCCCHKAFPGDELLADVVVYHADPFGYIQRSCWVCKHSHRYFADNLSCVK